MQLARSETCAQRRPRSSAEISTADCGHRIRPSNGEVRVVVTDRHVFSGIVRTIDPITHVRGVAEDLVAVQHAWRDEQMPEPLVVEAEGLVSTEGRRAWASVDDDVQNRAARATYELGLAAADASMDSADDPAERARLGILSERRAVDAMRGRGCCVERPGKEAARVVMRFRDEDQHAVESCSQHLHEADSDIRVELMVARDG